MSSPALKSKVAWMDRYKAPSVDELLDGFNKQLGGAVNHARERMLGVEGVKEGSLLAGRVALDPGLPASRRT